MASLLDRIDIAPSSSSSGPVRSRGGRAVSTPYERSQKLGQSKADEATVWRHDRYNGPGKTLSSRLSDSSRVNANGPTVALRQAMESRRSFSGADLIIKGASAIGANVVQIQNLASGTTAADVEAIFKRCGSIIEAHVHGPKNSEKVTVRLKFKNSDDARRAVVEYNGKSADGNILSVSIVGSASTSLGGRLSGGVALNGTVDVLMEEDTSSGGSKMRSDELLADPRAQVLTVPPGIDPAEYEVRGARGRRGRGHGRGWRGMGRQVRRTGSAMLID